MDNAVAKAIELHGRASSLAEAGDLDGASRAERAALKLFRRHLGRRSPDVANAHVELGRIAEAQGRSREAARQFAAALRIVGKTRARGDVAGVAANAAHGLGARLRSDGRYLEAERLLVRAETLAERAWGRSAPEMVVFLNERGVLYKYMGQFAAAARLYRRALKLMGHGHPQLATLYHNLAGLEHSRGRFARGEPIARAGLALRRRTLGREHPEVAADEAALAAILEGVGKRAEAERLYLHALAVFRRCYGPAHYEVAVNLENLAGLKSGREAERLYRQALQLKRRLLGARHPELAITLNNLGVHHLQRRDARAVPLFRRALALFERHLDASHPSVTTCRANLAAAEKLRLTP
jgi:tetratricopeptide (TPR) repeat protein